MSDGFGHVLSIIYFVGLLVEKMLKSRLVHSIKGVETYNFCVILETTVGGLEQKATRLRVSRHSDPIT